jgi:uncharacterized membrane protein
LSLLLGGIIGLVMSLRLTYLEFFVIHAICKWCIGSQILMGVVFTLILLEFLSFSKSKPELLNHPQKLSKELSNEI